MQKVPSEFKLLENMEQESSLTRAILLQVQLYALHSFLRQSSLCADDLKNMQKPRGNGFY